MKIFSLILLFLLAATPAFAKDKNADMTTDDVTAFTSWLTAKGVTYTVGTKKIDILIKDKTDGQIKYKSISIDKITRKEFVDAVKKILKDAGK